MNDSGIDDVGGTCGSIEVEEMEDDDGETSFDGYDLRDAIYGKWGECYDVEFQKVDAYGFRSVYLVSGVRLYI